MLLNFHGYRAEFPWILRQNIKWLSRATCSLSAPYCSFWVTLPHKTTEFKKRKGHCLLYTYTTLPFQDQASNSCFTFLPLPFISKTWVVGETAAMRETAVHKKNGCLNIETRQEIHYSKDRHSNERFPSFVFLGKM